MDDMPTIQAVTDLLVGESINQLWGEEGSDRDDLMLRIAWDWLANSHTAGVHIAVPHPYDPRPLMQQYEDLYPDVERNPLIYSVMGDTWQDLGLYLKNLVVTPYSLVMIPSPLESLDSLRTAHLVMPKLRDWMTEKQVTLLIVSDLPPAFRKKLDKNPTAELNVGTMGFHASVILHQNEVAWPGAIKILKHRTVPIPGSGIYRIAESPAPQRIYKLGIGTLQRISDAVACNSLWSGGVKTIMCHPAVASDLHKLLQRVPRRKSEGMFVVDFMDLSRAIEIRSDFGIQRNRLRLIMNDGGYMDYQIGRGEVTASYA